MKKDFKKILNRITIDTIGDLEKPVRRLAVKEPPEQRHPPSGGAASGGSLLPARVRIRIRTDPNKLQLYSIQTQL